MSEGRNLLAKMGHGRRKGWGDRGEEKRVLSAVACLWRQARDELIMTCWKKTTKQKNPAPNKRAWLPFNSQSNGKETLGLLMMRKPNIASIQFCSKSGERGSRTRLVRDHLACSNHQSPGCNEESRDKAGATCVASSSVQCKQPGHLGTSCAYTLGREEGRPAER